MTPDRVLFSLPNLRLAWGRISTGRNHQHKRYFREIYASYAIALEANLRDLHQRLAFGSFEPQAPTRLFLPKASGLQRPITLLAVEDQIVLQALANLLAMRLSARRRAVELSVVYSNVMEKKDDNIFFLRDWHSTYEAFTRKLRFFYRSGFRWVAAFDLAAYYDTISHDLLLRTAFPRRGLGEATDRIGEWLAHWTTEASTERRRHGIPQGPIASDFLAECFLLPIDEALGPSHGYVRYVDDIRLFARSEDEVRRAAIELERRCRNRGLIPQAKKFAISKARSMQEALGTLPSLGFAESGPEEGRRPISPAVALREFRQSLQGRPKRIIDKTRARFVLYRAAPAPRLARYVRLLLPHHPEHIDAFVFYLNQCSADDLLVRAVEDLVRSSPYDYVLGEAWQCLARIMRPAEMHALVDRAVRTARGRTSGFSAKWGALAFLCAAENAGLGRLARWASYQESPLLQALLADALPAGRFVRGDVAVRFLNRSACEPGLALTSRLVTLRLRPATLGVTSSRLPQPVQRVYRALGLVGNLVREPEPVAELLERSLGVARWDGWRGLLRGEYTHACQLLAQGASVYASHRSVWLIHQNAFDDAVTRALLAWLHTRGLPGAVATLDGRGRLVDFGNLVQAGNPFSGAYPPIADGFRNANSRRNALPAAHPYEKKSRARNSPLRAREQAVLAVSLRIAFEYIGKVVA